MKTKINILTTACILQLLVIYTTLGQSVEGFLKLVDYQQYDKAVTCLETIGSESAEHQDFYRGYLHLKEGNMNEAAKEFSAGALKFPKESLYLVGSGTIALFSNEMQKADNDFKKALQISKSKDPDVLYFIAEAYMEHKSALPEALKLVEKALDLHPENARYHLLKGDIHLAMHEGGKAVTSYENAAAFDKNNGIPYHNIGLLYWNGKNLSRAEEAFNQSAASDPTYAPVLKDLAELSFEKKDLVAAQSYYEKYIQLAGQISNAIKGRYGYFCYLNKSYEKSVEILQQVLNEENDNLLIYKYQAYALSQLESKEKALSAFEAYFSRASEEHRDWKDYEVYGTLLLESDNATEAVINLEKAHQKNSTSVELTQLIAETTFKLKQYPLAIQYYKKLIALRKAPYAQDYYILGRSHYYQEAYASADSTFTTLISLQPQSHIGYLWKARSLSNLDPETEQGLAKTSYEKVVELLPAEEVKYKQDLKEAHAYLGYYFYLKADFDNSVIHWKRVQEIDPADERAKEALKSLMN